MRAKLGVREVPQFMLQSLRESLHAGLGNIVGGISGGVVMPCFEPVLMMRPGRPRSIMPGTRPACHG